MSTLRFGVIGGGHLGTIHTRLLNQCSDVSLVGVADPIAETRAKIVSEMKVPAFPNHTDLIGKIDAAIVATPTVLHEQVASDLIEAGVHVLIEKPITHTIAQANRLIQLAHDNQVILQVGHVEQFNPTWLTAKSHIQDPVYIEAHRCGPFSGRSTDISVVHDLMIHDLELILSLVPSKVVSEKAYGSSMLTSKEDYVCAALEFENGCEARIVASRVHPIPKREMHLITRSAQWFLDFASSGIQRTELHPLLGRHNPEVDFWDHQQLEEARSNTENEFLKCESIQVEPGNAIASEHADFIRCIQDNQQPQVSGEAARDALALAERIVDDIRRGPDRLKTAA